jgi:membrane protein implicated in regulation of membrane protease activity
MNTFTKDQRVRITPEYAKADGHTDTSFEKLVGKVGIVTEALSECGQYVRVALPETEWAWLFLPEELEAV